MSERRNNKRPRHDNRRDEKPEKSAADIAAQDAELLASKNPYMPMFLNFRAELDEHHDRRERVIKASRDVTAASKKMIFSLQRYVCVCSEVSRNLPACLPACLFETCTFILPHGSTNLMLMLHLFLILHFPFLRGANLPLILPHYPTLMLNQQTSYFCLSFPRT
jgi:hypothetical protein